MKRYCKNCRTIHDGICDNKPHYISRKRDSQADLFRNTQRWRKKSAEILERDYHCCRICLKAGIRTNYGLSVHHIIPLAVDFERRLDDDNLITLCEHHHKRAEKSYINKRELLALASADVVLPPLK